MPTEPPCVWCGEPGWHGTTDQCQAVLAAAIAIEQRRLRLVPVVAPARVCGTCGQLWPDDGRESLDPQSPTPRIESVHRGAVAGCTPDVLIPSVKAAIVDRMLLAESGELVPLARVLGLEFDVKFRTIVNSWRRWARERK
jgi:hypothetical protein